MFTCHFVSVQADTAAVVGPFLQNMGKFVSLICPALTSSQ